MANTSKLKRIQLVDKIKAIKSFIALAKQDGNTSQLLAFIVEIEKELLSKKYGLIFEEHNEEIDEIQRNYAPIIIEDTSLFINNDNQVNFIIEGDNLASLQILVKTHKNKIEVIYIDPPYNTGAKNWKYNNDYVDGTDTFRHSKWLSFMKSRLLLSKQLLSNDGIIILTIDD